MAHGKLFTRNSPVWKSLPASLQHISQSLGRHGRGTDARSSRPLVSFGKSPSDSDCAYVLCWTRTYMNYALASASPKRSVLKRQFKSVRHLFGPLELTYTCHYLPLVILHSYSPRTWAGNTHSHVCLHCGLGAPYTVETNALVLSLFPAVLEAFERKEYSPFPRPA